MSLDARPDALLLYTSETRSRFPRTLFPQVHRKLSAAGVQSASWRAHRGDAPRGGPDGDVRPGASHIFEATLARLSDFCDELQADAEEEPLEAAAGTTSAHLH